MEGSTELSILVEVAVALAGFSGMVVAVRGHHSTHSWETFRAVALLVTGSTMLVAALLPFAIHSFGVQGPNLWRLSSAAVVLLTLAPVVPMFRYMPTDYRASPFYRHNTAVAMSVMSVALVANVLNALAIGTEGVFSLFYLGIVLNVPSVAVQFLVVLIAAQKE
jgi:hypothetical protein